ncbi:Uma2 family endonuclease [Streptomyces sp. NPDC003077]|uniref:Uma2 family endonuclease n=1 Tax=Streptomyces sp. NPDC003077 TaxID=3154443 RepID=UPI0033B28F77
MTAVDDRPITESITEYFEDLQVPEGYKCELLRGDIVMMAGPSWVHNMIVLTIQRQIFPEERWNPVTTQDIAIPGEASRPQPDLVVVESGAYEGAGHFVPAPAVTLVLEVVSKNSADRDYRIKRSIYAAGGIPTYLIVDPFTACSTLLTEPAGAGEEADYVSRRVFKFGDSVPLDDLGVLLRTDDFQTLPSH